jgi:hypothetical protein
MSPTDEVVVERRDRSQPPVRRLFETRTLTRLQEILIWVVIGGGALLLSPFGWVAVVWLALGAVAVVVGRVRQSTHPRDHGVQVYDDVRRLDPSPPPAGARSPQQLYLPYGLALGWFARRGLVSDWFRRESGDELDDLLAGRLTGPQLYARWNGIFASDMLDDEGKAFARRYLWGVEPHGALQTERVTSGRPFGRNAWAHPRPEDQWFLLDLEALRGDVASVYLLPDTPETAAGFARLADRRLARWRRWRFVYALYESERVAVRRRFSRHYAFPP